MKNTIVTIIAVLIGLLVVDRIGGYMMSYLTANSNTVSVGRISYAIHRSTSDLLILGSSRAQHHYVSTILEDSLNMSVYNAGIDEAEGINVQLPLLQIILERYTPKMVILEVSEGDFNTTVKTDNIISLLAPYYGISDAADSMFAYYKKSLPYEVSHLYRYTSTSWSNLVGVIKTIPRNFEEKGYDPITYVMKDTIIKDQPFVQHKNFEKLSFLQTFIDICKTHNISLVLCNSPKYTRVDGLYFRYIHEIANKNKIPFFDYHTAGVFWDKPEYFSDNAHLNDKGARKFTSMVAKDFLILYKR